MRGWQPLPSSTEDSSPAPSSSSSSSHSKGLAVLRAYTDLVFDEDVHPVTYPQVI